MNTLIGIRPCVMTASGNRTSQTPSTSPVALDFLPPMSSMGKANGQAESNVAIESTGSPDTSPAKKRRLGADEEPDSQPEGSSSAGTNEDKPSVVSSETDERTSKDYYFDSYAHHAIRKFQPYHCL